MKKIYIVLILLFVGCDSKKANNSKVSMPPIVKNWRCLNLSDSIEFVRLKQDIFTARFRRFSDKLAQNNFDRLEKSRLIKSGVILKLKKNQSFERIRFFEGLKIGNYETCILVNNMPYFLPLNSYYYKSFYKSRYENFNLLNEVLILKKGTFFSTDIENINLYNQLKNQSIENSQYINIDEFYQIEIENLYLNGGISKFSQDYKIKLCYLSKDKQIAGFYNSEGFICYFNTKEAGIFKKI